MSCSGILQYKYTIITNRYLLLNEDQSSTGEDEAKYLQNIAERKLLADEVFYTQSYNIPMEILFTGSLVGG